MRGTARGGEQWHRRMAAQCTSLLVPHAAWCQHLTTNRRRHGLTIHREKTGRETRSCRVLVCASAQCVVRTTHHPDVETPSYSSANVSHAMGSVHCILARSLTRQVTRLQSHVSCLLALTTRKPLPPSTPPLSSSSSVSARLHHRHHQHVSVDCLQQRHPQLLRAQPARR